MCPASNATKQDTSEEKSGPVETGLTGPAATAPSIVRERAIFITFFP